MFPTLGLFASVRCPELTGCKRKPCLYSHSAPAPRQFAIATSKRPAEEADEKEEDNGKRSKTSRSSSFDYRPTSGGPASSRLFAPASSASTPSAHEHEDDAATPRSSGTQPVGALGTGGFRKPAIQISKTGQVIRKGIPASSSLRTAPSPSLAGTSHARTTSTGTSANGPGSSSSPSTSASTSKLAGTNGSSLATTAGSNGSSRSYPASTFASSVTSLTTSIGPPRLPLNTKNSYFPIATRNAMLKNIHLEFANIYSTLPNRSEAARLASAHALAQEEVLYTANNKFSYRNACIATIARLKKRPPAVSAADTGTMEDWDARNKLLEEEERLRLTPAKAKALVASPKVLLAHDYILEVPPGEGGLVPTEEGGSKTCDRCGADYIVHGNLSDAERVACKRHWGRVEVSSKGMRIRSWSCCTLPVGAPGCSSGPHVFLEKSAVDLHSRSAFTATKDLVRASNGDDSVSDNGGKRAADIVALDCEMIYTTAGMAIARVTILDADARVLLDEYIVPNGMTVDLVTRWSGVTEEALENKARLTLQQLKRRKLGSFLDEKTYIIGHGLENDLKALRIVHPADRIIDTAILYPHSRGLPYRHSLKNLAQEHLKIFIQDRGAEGHSSSIDSKAALDLAKLKGSKLT